MKSLRGESCVNNLKRTLSLACNPSLLYSPAADSDRQSICRDEAEVGLYTSVVKVCLTSSCKMSAGLGIDRSGVLGRAILYVRSGRANAVPALEVITELTLRWVPSRMTEAGLEDWDLIPVCLRYFLERGLSAGREILDPHGESPVELLWVATSRPERDWGQQKVSEMEGLTDVSRDNRIHLGKPPNLA